MLITFKLLKAYILVWWPSFSYIDPHKATYNKSKTNLYLLYYYKYYHYQYDYDYFAYTTNMSCFSTNNKKNCPSTINLNYDNVLGP